MSFSDQVLKIVRSFDSALQVKFDSDSLIVNCTEDQAQKISRKLTQVFDLAFLKCKCDGTCYCFSFSRGF